MNAKPIESFVLAPNKVLEEIRDAQKEILLRLNTKPDPSVDSNSRFLTAVEFMACVRICRSKFDSLIQSNSIKSVKKKRKIYVPASEVDRYFSDPTIK